MNPPTSGSGSTWVSIDCGRCRHHYVVRQDAGDATRACPLCRHAQDPRPIPGFRIRALMEGSPGGT